MRSPDALSPIGEIFKAPKSGFHITKRIYISIMCQSLSKSFLQISLKLRLNSFRVRVVLSPNFGAGPLSNYSAEVENKTKIRNHKAYRYYVQAV